MDFGLDLGGSLVTMIEVFKYRFSRAVDAPDRGLGICGTFYGDVDFLAIGFVEPPVGLSEPG